LYLSSLLFHSHQLTTEDYSQCVPGIAAAPTDADDAPTAVATDAASSTLSGGTSSASSPGTTLQSSYYWIRAVESPNFHKYLQTKPEYTPGTAILDSYTTAGQFQIVSGQLVQLIGGGSLLYANVEQNTTAAVKLSLTFNTTKNAYGTFAFSGDAVQWSTPGINRPNLSAWLVCANQQLFINLGNYDYMTPAGCADETVSGRVFLNKRSLLTVARFIIIMVRRLLVEKNERNMA
jgi:hypothetical protein